jgi:hypothetical protein
MRILLLLAAVFSLTPHGAPARTATASPAFEALPALQRFAAPTALLPRQPPNPAAGYRLAWRELF